jgi:hypothetical protein
MIDPSLADLKSAAPPLPGRWAGLNREERRKLMWAYLHKAGAILGQQVILGPDYPCYRLATQLFARDLYLGGVSREEITRLLDAMVPIEREWITIYRSTEH